MTSLLITAGQAVFTVLMYVLGSAFFGLAMVPGAVLVWNVWAATEHAALFPRLFLLCFSLSLGYFSFGIVLVILVGIFRTGLGLRLQEGVHPVFSAESVKWAFVSSLYLMIHYTFIDFILLTPFANLLFRMLGAKLGRNVQFNSKFVFDASLLEIGDDTVVGGGAIINGHAVERGKLVLKKVRIGKGVLLGSHCTVMPGCDIGDHAIIGPGAVLLKDTRVEARDVWYGLPAESLREKKRKERQEAREGTEGPGA